MEFGDDATMLPDGTPPVSGRAAIEAMFARVLAPSAITDATITTRDVIVSGDLVIEVGVNSTTRGASGVTKKGKYLVVWKRQTDGQWKIHLDIWNADERVPDR